MPYVNHHTSCVVSLLASYNRQRMISVQGTCYNHARIVQESCKNRARIVQYMYKERVGSGTCCVHLIPLQLRCQSCWRARACRERNVLRAPYSFAATLPVLPACFSCWYAFPAVLLVCFSSCRAVLSLSFRATLLAENHSKDAFFLLFSCICQKKVVPLHPILYYA